MTSTTSTTDIDPTGLPATIRDFLAAHTARRTDDAIRLFDADAVVVDDGHTYRGTEEVLEFLTTAGSEFTYTTTLVGFERTGDTRWLVRNRVEGDFPGGIVDLAYRFTLTGEHIAELTIGA